MDEHTRPSWEREDDETAKAFAAFSIYRDMPASERSLEKVRRKLGKRRGYSGQLERWSSQYRWVQRARDYDMALDSARLQAQERERLQMGERQAKAAVTLQKAALRRLLATVDSMDGRTALLAYSKGAEEERLARGEPADIFKMPRKPMEEYSNQELDAIIAKIKEIHGL